MAIRACSLEANIVKEAVIEERDDWVCVDVQRIASEKVSVIADKRFYGNGLIQSPNVRILTDKFQFTGTIDCSKECIILSQEPVDQSTFKCTGPGVFTIANKEEVKAAWSNQKEEDHNNFVQWRNRRLRHLLACAPPELPKLTEEEKQDVQKLAAFPLQSIFEGGEGRKDCGAICEEIHQRFENRYGNGDLRLTRIFEALLFECDDGRSRKYHAERAWLDYCVEQRRQRHSLTSTFVVLK